MLTFIYSPILRLDVTVVVCYVIVQFPIYGFNGMILSFQNSTSLEGN